MDQVVRKVCFRATKWEDRKDPVQEILSNAILDFDPHVNNTESGPNENGVDLRTGRVMVTCWQLVNYTLTKLGLPNTKRSADIVPLVRNCFDENKQFVLQPFPTCNSDYDSQYFTAFDFDDRNSDNPPGRGDIVLWLPNPYWECLHPDVVVSPHINILESRITVENGKYHFWTYGCEDPDGAVADSYGIHSKEQWLSTTGGVPDPQFVCAIIRPKKPEIVFTCVYPVVKDRPNLPRTDPLVLDLDGNGIQTLGLSAGIHFDHDRNGFKELTGWVAPGEGMLMLDTNGNGRLDDATELLGDFTILPNGMRASNGFQALAYYDANGDGKIDAQDPIWSQLRIWQDVDYIPFLGGG